LHVSFTAIYQRCQGFFDKLAEELPYLVYQESEELGWSFIFWVGEHLWMFLISSSFFAAHGEPCVFRAAAVTSTKWHDP